MTNDLSIAAVFATMNRAATAAACVRALAAQTRPPERVVVADNVSVDGTAEALESLRCLPFELVVHRMAENRGNAGGVEEAMEIAFSKGADAVWILDDDSWPRPEALAALIHEAWDPAVVRHALQVDPTNGRFTWPMWARKDGRWFLAYKLDELPTTNPQDSRASWTGAVVSRLVRDEVGPVNGELFIRGEDEEYPWRIERAGFRFESVPAAVMDHPGPENLLHWRIFGRNFFFERGLADWKLYYKVRNLVWLKRQQAGDLNAVALFLIYAFAAVSSDGWRRFGIVREAAVDGWQCRLGKWRNH